MEQKPRIAVVTGAGQGLGAAVAANLAERGFRVALLGRTMAKLQAVAATLPGDPICKTLDLCEPDQVRACFRSLDEAGPLTALVNNAAVYSPFRLDEATDEQIASVVQSSFIAPMYTMREAIPRIRAAGGGDIVNVSSESVRFPLPFLTVYAACKAALEHLTDSLRHETRGEGVRFSLFQTGMINAPNSGATWDREIAARVHEAWTTGGYIRFLPPNGVTPETLAKTIAHIICLPAEAMIHTVHMGPPSSHAGLVPRE